MARTVLPTNFVDDVLNSLMGGKRRYRMINNADGTVSFEDATTYDVEGSIFGASRVNEIAQNVNESADVADVGDMENLPVPTDTITENIGSLGEKLPSDILGFSVGEDEKPYITYKVGADTVVKKLGDINWKLVLDVTWNYLYQASHLHSGAEWTEIYTKETYNITKTVTITRIDETTSIEFDSTRWNFRVGYNDLDYYSDQWREKIWELSSITVESFEFL